MRFVEDLRFAWRGMRKRPLATALAVLTLGAGIGATTAAFSVLNAVAFRDLPVKNPAELAEMSITMGPSNNVGFSVPMVQELVRTQPVFSSVVGFVSQLANADTADGLTQINLLLVTNNFFSELGVRPEAGRLIAQDDMNLATFSGQPAAVLGYGFWQRRYGGDPGVVGKTIRIDARPCTIVGVAPRGFSAFSVFTEPDVTMQLTADAPSQSAGLLWIHLVGRRKPGISLDQARAGLAPLWTSIKADIVPANFAAARRANFLGLGLNVRAVRTGLEWNGRNRFTEPLTFAFVLAVVVLIVACLNVVGLMLARTAGQTHDIGIRLALGASSWDLRRQAIAEALALAVLGGALGLAAAQLAAPFVARFMLQEWTGAIALQLTPDAHVVLLVGGIVATVCVLFGALPVWRVHARAGEWPLASGSRVTAGVGRLAPILVAAQVALALVISIDAGLIVRTLQHFAAADTGFSRAGVTLAELMPAPGVQYGGATPATNAYDRQLVDTVRAATGASGVALTAGVPLIGIDWTRAITPADAPGNPIDVAYDPVSPDFARFFGLHITDGRDFTWDDNSGRARIAIVSESLARRLAPGRSAVGEYINFGPTPAGQHIEVVGVVADFKLYDVKNGSPLVLLVPVLQNPESAQASILVRGPAAGDALRKAVSSLGQEYVLRARSLDEVSEAATRQERLASMAGSLFGAIAIALAALGLYGLLSYIVSRRTREFAIRAALGGRAWRLMALVLAEGSTIGLAGVLLGSIAVVVNVRWLQSLLFGIRLSDAVALAVVPLALAAASVAACAIPATRAARIDPLILMRDE
jgi:predicted permease